MRSRIKITVENEHRIEISDGGQVVEGWCKSCQAPTAILSPSTVATLAGVSIYAVYRWMEVGRFHTVEPVSRGWRICQNSLDGHLRKMGLASKVLADFMRGHVLNSGWEETGLPAEWQSETND